MKCNICGGVIRFQGGIAVCDNCGSRIKLENNIEKTDVFLCYIENDAQGRRSRDSIIAQEIYNKLSESNIKAYYERISASNLTGDQLEVTNYQAIIQAEIVLIIGCTREHFQQLVETNNKYWEGKTLLPIYAGIDAYELPEELRKYQALNYESIGAIEDLNNTILKIMGREEEVEVIKVANEAKNRLRRRKNVILGIVSIFLVVSLLGAIFGQDYLTERKYENAVSSLEQGKRIEALQAFSELSGYKDSDNLRNKIYDYYEGYYENEDRSLRLEIRFKGDSTIEILIEKVLENKSVRVSETSLIDVNKAVMQFTDSENQKGSAEVELTDESIELQTKTKSGKGVFSVGNNQVSFPVNKKKDRTLVEDITAETLMKWNETQISKGELLKSGIDISYKRKADEAQSNPDYMEIWTVNNTDYQLLLCKYDIFNYDLTNGDEWIQVDDYKVLAVAGPASVMIASRVGEASTPFVEKGILYVPSSSNASVGASEGSDGMLHCDIISVTDALGEEKGDVIEADMTVWAFSEKTYGKERLNTMEKINKGIWEVESSNSSATGAGINSDENYEDESGNPASLGAIPYTATVQVDAFDGGVNFRKAPGARSAKLQSTMIPNGTVLDISYRIELENGTTWGFTYYNGKYGWVYLDACYILSDDGYGDGDIGEWEI